ncbi:MAG: DUF4197 domain-containing protein [Acidiferrobacterales bacterium]
MTIIKIFLFAAILVLLPACAGNAGFLQDLQKELEKHSSPTVPSQQQMISAMRQALEQGSEHATGSLGKPDGFLGNPKVRIPVPSPLRNIEQGMRKLGQGKMADAFIVSLNRAAERATPLAKDILLNAIRKMSVQDVVNIIRGPENAATTYFRNKTTARLTTALLPIVTGATNSVGVTRSYKNMVRQAGPLAAFVDLKQLDLDTYITRKTLDGLFLLIADEEKRIRKDPVARSTELLKKVFGGKW